MIALILLIIQTILIFILLHYHSRIELGLKGESYKSFFLDAFIPLMMKGGISLGMCPFPLYFNSELPISLVKYNVRRSVVCVIFWVVLLCSIILLITYGERSGLGFEYIG